MMDNGEVPEGSISAMHRDLVRQDIERDRRDPLSMPYLKGVSGSNRLPMTRTVLGYPIGAAASSSSSSSSGAASSCSSSSSCSMSKGVPPFIGDKEIKLLAAHLKSLQAVKEEREVAESGKSESAGYLHRFIADVGLWGAVNASSLVGISKDGGLEVDSETKGRIEVYFKWVNQNSKVPTLRALNSAF